MVLDYTDDNEVLIVDTSDPTMDPEEMLSWWKATDPGKFKMGSEEYWRSQMHNNATPPTRFQYGSSDLAEVKLPAPYDAVSQLAQNTSHKNRMRI